MIISNNNIANKAYTPYKNNVAQLGKVAQRLGTGKKYANASDGSAEISVAQRMKMNIAGTNKLFSGMSNALNLSKTQDEILGHVGDIVTRMTELATGAADPTKTAADRSVLENEFRALATEVADIAADAKFNGGRLFETDRTVRIGMESTDVVALSQIRLSLLTFVNESVSTVAAASGTLISLKSRVGSLAVLRNKARGHAARLERVMGYTQDYVANLESSQSAITDIDVARESGEFTKKQVMLAASQSILAQANGLTQGALQFLN
jgi:flagellin